MDNRRTINTILNLTWGNRIEVDELFEDQEKREAEIFQLRTKIEEQIQNNSIEYVCIYCKQPVVVRGRRNFTDHTTQYECLIKTQSQLTEEQVRCIKYNGEKESKLHDTLKNLIGYYLQQDPNVSNVKVDKVYKEKAISKDWRKPDVLAFYNDKKNSF
jgi:hypothetical protein